MSARHTPGPWSVEDPFDFELTIVEAGKPSHQWGFIASCGLPDGDDDQAFSAREIHANARLIAAAPDLLYVATLVTEIASILGENNAIVQLARAAVAKATGK